MNDDSFPRFQYSVFTHNDHDRQFVVRGNDWNQFLLDKQAVLIEIGKETGEQEVAKAFATSSPAVPDVTPTNLGFCKKCGAKNVVNPKTSNVFCSNKCWLKNEA